MSKKSSNTRTVNTAKNFATGIGVEMMTIILRIVTRTVFIYALGKEYLGINGLFSDILTMLSLTELGIDTAILFRMYKPMAEKDDHRIRVLLKFYKKAYFIIGLTILVLGVCLIPLLPHLIKDYEKLSELNINAVLFFLLLLSQSVSSYMFFAYRSSVVIASQKKYLLGLANLVFIIVQNAAQIAILVLWKSFIGFTLAGTVFTILRNLVYALIAKRKFPQYFVPEPDNVDKKEVREMLKDCGALFTYKVNEVVLKATDNLVLSKFIGLAMVGQYSNYLLLYTMSTRVFNQVYSAVSASTGNLFATEGNEKTYSFFRSLLFLTFVFYGTGAAGIVVCADELIRNWLTNDYVILQPFSMLIGMELLLTGLANHLAQTRTSSGIFQKMWYRPLIGIAVNIAVSIVMVQVCGIYGVIIGTLVSHLSTTFAIDPYIVYKYTFQNYKPVSEYYKYSLMCFAVLAAVCAADYFICQSVFVGYGWLSLFAHILITGASVPLAFYAVFRKTEECKYLVRIATNIANKILKRRPAGERLS